PDGRSFTLSTRDEVVVQKGTLGDSIGRSVGLLWAPPAGSLRPEQVIDFSVVGIRSAAKTLSEKLVPSVDREVNFLTLSLTGADPEKTATVVNAITDQYVQVAAELKRAKLTQLSAILQDQLNVSAGNLNQAEAALQDFKVNTITLPSDRGAPVSAGLQMTQDPVFDNYFSMKIQQEQLQRDRETINRVLADARNGPLSVFALEAVPSLAQSPSLQASLAELNVQRASLRALQDRYTDQYGQVADAQAAIDKLELETIPQQAAALVSALVPRERALGSLMGCASTELRRIPERTIEVGRLQRRAVIAEAMYTDLQSRTEEARL